MSEPVDYAVNATLKKWPSLNGERISLEEGAIPYTLMIAALSGCVRELLSKPETQHRLYEIHLHDGQVLSATDALTIRVRSDFPAE